MHQVSVVVVAMLALSVASCADDVGGSDTVGSGRYVTPPAKTPGVGEVPVRPYERLSSDQPGGPSPVPSAPTEPDPEQIQTAASSSSTRADGERIAILLNHALENQSSPDTRVAALDRLGPDTSLRARQEIGAIPTLPGTRVVPTTQSWIRSVTDGETVKVRLVEQVEAPALGEPGEPYRLWIDNTLTVAHGDYGWRLIDFQRAVASESVEFSEPVWRMVMSSGRDWRRFAVGG